MAESQGRQSTITYLIANLHKKDEARRVAETALPLAEHLDNLQMILGERLRRVVGIDLWQFVRNGGKLGLSTDTAQGPIITPYASSDRTRNFSQAPSISPVSFREIAR